MCVAPVSCEVEGGTALGVALVYGLACVAHTHTHTHTNTHTHERQHTSACHRATSLNGGAPAVHCVSIR